MEYFMHLLTPAIFDKLRQKPVLQKKLSYEFDLDIKVVLVSSENLSKNDKYTVLCSSKHKLWPSHPQLLK